MYMADWITKLDDFLKLSERDVLKHAGTVSHEGAVAKAELEFDRFAASHAGLPSIGERDFEAAVRDVKKVETERKTAKPQMPRPRSSKKT
jgi:hypothetical protein